MSFTKRLDLNSLSKSLTAFCSVLTYLFKSICLALIKCYQVLLSPFFGGHCRFYPSCSHYAQEAFEVHSLTTAFRLVFLRLIKCHPFGGKGFDPVPKKQTFKKKENTDGQ